MGRWAGWKSGARRPFVRQRTEERRALAKTGFRDNRVCLFDVDRGHGNHDDGSAGSLQQRGNHEYIPHQLQATCVATRFLAIGSRGRLRRREQSSDPRGASGRRPSRWRLHGSRVREPSIGRHFRDFVPSSDHQRSYISHYWKCRSSSNRRCVYRCDVRGGVRDNI